MPMKSIASPTSNPEHSIVFGAGSGALALAPMGRRKEIFCVKACRCNSSRPRMRKKPVNPLNAAYCRINPLIFDGGCIKPTNALAHKMVRVPFLHAMRGHLEPEAKLNSLVA